MISCVFYFSYHILTFLSLCHCRGEDLRELKIAMLLKGELPRVGPVKCTVIGGSLRVVKERINNMECLIGWSR